MNMCAVPGHTIYPAVCSEENQFNTMRALHELNHIGNEKAACAK
jgi:hypothetical protein